MWEYEDEDVGFVRSGPDTESPCKSVRDGGFWEFFGVIFARLGFRIPINTAIPTPVGIFSRED